MSPTAAAVQGDHTRLRVDATEHVGAAIHDGAEQPADKGIAAKSVCTQFLNTNFDPHFVSHRMCGASFFQTPLI